jgi:sugar-phosphatase
MKLSAAALLFDMDGTLVNSNAAVERSWAYWARRHDLDLAEVLHYSHGRPTLATMNYFGSRFAPGADWSADAEEMMRVEQEDLSGIQAIPGSAEILAQLDTNCWAVVTSAPRQLAESRIQVAGLPLPRVLVPADEITNGKPHPEGYLKAAAMLGFAASDCVVFEDTPPGVEAGLNAGMPVIGLLTTVSGERLGTSYLIRDYFDLRVSREGVRFGIEIPNLQ